MDGSSSPPSDSNRSPNKGASKFLSNLPSRGLFSSTVLSSNPGGMRVYVCVNDTSPPESQQIKTNQQNILIRSLTLRNKKVDSSLKDVKSASGGAAESSKRGPLKELWMAGFQLREPIVRVVPDKGSSSQASNRDYQRLTVERLRALLKARGLSLRGKKEELIARLKGASG